MSFFLSFYRFFLPSSLVEGKPCLSRPLIVRRHVWRLCVLSALLCCYVLLRSEAATTSKGWLVKHKMWLFLFIIFCPAIHLLVAVKHLLRCWKILKKTFFFFFLTPLLLHNNTLDILVCHLNFTLCMSLTCSEYWLTWLLHYWSV